ncbi:predicted protein [Histoplasma capsulatum var. duboisii H88]|uniref:Predicted protein n=1 Tax=Ajellomyces capsulatus (strain H88) TaxID=544711 RepID=F0U6D4_AJEC8|nr:predicted protein [Histoplasma capsulatum var. duboisii H88]
MGPQAMTGLLYVSRRALECLAARPDKKDKGGKAEKRLCNAPVIFGPDLDGSQMRERKLPLIYAGYVFKCKFQAWRGRASAFRLAYSMCQCPTAFLALLDT